MLLNRKLTNFTEKPKTKRGIKMRGKHGHVVIPVVRRLPWM